MQQPDLRLVRTIARRLTAAVELRVEREADAQIDRVMRGAFRSDAHLESTFVAVQTLRDLGVISKPEGAYLFHYMLDLWQWSEDRKLDPGISRLAEESPEHIELLEAAISHQDLMETETFYRSRGEFELADLVAKDMDAYHTLVASGQVSIFEHKHHAGFAPADERSTDSREVMERVLALASHESFKEWLRTWLALVESLKHVTPATAVRAIQEAREIGALDFEESLRLMDHAVDELVWRECHADRQYSRLELTRDKLYETLGIKHETAEDQRPFEYRMVEARLRERFNGLNAVVLRRFGEHRIANLLIDDPLEYERIRDS